jgi:hypothetical protein
MLRTLVKQHRAKRRAVMGTAIAALLVLGLLGAQASLAAGACPSSAAGSRPTSGQTVVACVGARRITAALARHWVMVARNAAKTSAPSEHELIAQAMGFLISGDWVIGEAHDLRVHVRAATVKHKFSLLRKQQFPKPGAFAKFLKETGQTISDLLMRVELNLLSEGIQHRVEAGRHGMRSRQKALAHFVAHFKRKWKAKTYCTAAYAVMDCGHVQSAL